MVLNFLSLMSTSIFMLTCPCPCNVEYIFILYNWGLQGFALFSYFCSKTKIVGTR